MKFKKIEIDEIQGFVIGNAEDREGGTGCTVIIAENGAVAGVDVRGGAPATRETDLLRSENTVDKIHAVMLSGGSAFGLEAACGAMRSLRERGIGFRLGDKVIPLVTGASLYDLEVGRPDAFPDVAMGMEAVDNAYSGHFEHGNYGAGTGASVGKMLGMERAMKTGLGTFACSDDVVQVGAIAAVNACADVYNGAGNIVAGLRTMDGLSIYGTIKALQSMVHEGSEAEPDLSDIRAMARKDESVRRPERKPERTEVRQSPQSDIADSRKAIAKAIRDAYNNTQTAAAKAETGAQEEPVSAMTASLQASEPETAILTEVPADHEVSESRSAYDSSAPDIQAAASWEAMQPEVHAEVSSAAPDRQTVKADTEVNVIKTGSEPPEGAAVSAVDIENTDMTSPESPESPAEEAAAEIAAETAAAETAPISAADEDYPQELPYELTEEDMGYNVPFNTTIACLITNAAMTKSQANKLAVILHDAYARAIKPVHTTMDGDTIFVMTTGTEKVNFDAFAALATDVMQYAVIDAAVSAEGSYGLPASRDIIVSRR